MVGEVLWEPGKAVGVLLLCFPSRNVLNLIWLGHYSTAYVARGVVRRSIALRKYQQSFEKD